MATPSSHRPHPFWLFSIIFNLQLNNMTWYEELLTAYTSFNRLLHRAAGNSVVLLFDFFELTHIQLHFSFHSWIALVQCCKRIPPDRATLMMIISVCFITSSHIPTQCQFCMLFQHENRDRKSVWNTRLSALVHVLLLSKCLTKWETAWDPVSLDVRQIHLAKKKPSGKNWILQWSHSQGIKYQRASVTLLSISYRHTT